jgi:hypothetical protein
MRFLYCLDALVVAHSCKFRKFFSMQSTTEVKKVYKKFTFISPSSREPRCRATVLIDGSASTASRKGLLSAIEENIKPAIHAASRLSSGEIGQPYFSTSAARERPWAGRSGNSECHQPRHSRHDHQGFRYRGAEIRRSSEFEVGGPISRAAMCR